MTSSNRNTLIQSVGVRNIYILFIIYFIANITYLVNIDALYWDDWVVYNQEYSTLARFAEMIRNTTYTLNFVFLNIFNNIGNGIYGFRLSLFLMYFISALIVIYILKTIKIFNNQSAYLIGLFYLINPVFHTKAVITILQFYVSVFLFFIAWYWLASNIKKLYWYHRVIILLLFFNSFVFNSLLVLYALVPLYIFYKQYYDPNEKINFLNKVKNFLRGNIDFILVPIVFFIYKLVFMNPSGLYAGYNEISIKNLKVLLKTNFDFPLFNFIENSAILFWEFGLISAVIAILAMFLPRFREFLHIKLPTYKVSVIMLAIGLFGMLLAIFPYSMVGKVPTLFGWDSRFYLLTLVPESIVLYAFLMLVLKSISNLPYICIKETVRNQISIGIFMFLVTIFLCRSLHDQHRLNIDWFYQFGIQQNFIDSTVISNNQTFVVYNNTQSSFAYGRTFNHYEWTGLLKQAFNDDSRLMVPSYIKRKNIPSFKRLGDYKHYNHSTWKMTNPIGVRIEYKQDLDAVTIAKLYWYRLFNNDQYKDLSKKLVSISYIYKFKEQK